MFYNGLPRPGFGPLPGASLDLNFLTRTATALGRLVNLDALLTNGRTGPARFHGPDRGALRVAQAGEPRYGYHPRSGQPRGLLVEPQGFNFLLSSNDFSASGWIKGNGATVAAGTGVGLDGTQSASLFSDPYSGNSQGQMVQVIGVSGVAPWCGSVFLRPTASSYPVRLFLLTQAGSTFTASKGATFNLGEGRVASVDPGCIATIEPAPFGFLRCSVLAYTAAGDTALSLGLQRANAGDPQSTYEIAQAALENRSAPSSVMPTTGAVGSRAADAYTLALDPAWVNPAELTLYVEAEMLGPDVSGYPLALRDGSGPGVPANRIDILRSASGPQFVCETTSGTYIGSLYGAGVPGIHRLAFSCKAGAFIAAKTGGGGDYVDTGQGVISAGGGTMPIGLSRLDLGHLGTNGVMSGYLRRVAIIPRALSAGDLSDLLR